MNALPLKVRAAVAHYNVEAFLRTIREGESSQMPEAYCMRYHPQRITYFSDLSKHPNILEETPVRANRPPLKLTLIRMAFSRLL